MEQVKNNEFKKKFAIVLCFLVLMVCITGSTYAYFALTASSNNITGNVGGAGLSLTVTKKFPTANKNMIPQLESTLDRAISDEFSCIDGNGNMVCQVYQATVTNSSSVAAKVNGTIRFEGIEREAGLYDDNWNMVASWDELVNDYGLDIDSDDIEGVNDNTISAIIRRNSEFSNVTKVVVGETKVIGAYQFRGLDINFVILPDGLETIGYAAFTSCGKLKEILIPETVVEIKNNGFTFDPFYGDSNLTTIYYSGTASGAPWGATNATIVAGGEEKKLSMPNLKWKRIDGERIIGSYSSNTATVAPVIFDENKLFDAGATENYYFVIWIDEIGMAQYDRGTFRAVIEFNTSDEGLTSTIKPNATLLSDYIISLYNDGSSTTNATVGDGPQTVSLNSTQKLMKVNQGDTYGEEYRYYGASPNNYVDFNGELWRIISVSKVFSNESDTIGETRVRIIKDTSIGEYTWDYESVDSYTNNWSDATLMCQLNTLYYNDTLPACTGKSLTSLTTSLNAEARNLIDNALWYLGGGDNSDLYADDYYTMERGTAVADSSYPYRWTGKIGIMYPSDYAYASDLSQCTKTGLSYNTDTTNCTGTDWLFNGDYQWLMSPNSVHSYGAWCVYEDGDVDSGVGGVFGEGGVRPLAVLKSDVTKLEGEGTSGNPYKLGLGT